MRIYNVILSHLPQESSDFKFAKTINDNKFEWWRYTMQNWIIATPDNISTNQIMTYTLDAYGAVFFVILEITINDVGGIFPSKKGDLKEGTPFEWFYKIKDPSFVPKWEKE